MDGCELLLRVLPGAGSSPRQRAGSRTGPGTAASGGETLLEAVRG